MLPSLRYLIGVSNTSGFVVNSENSIAAAKRKSYFVVDMHRLHADFRFSHAQIRCHTAGPPKREGNPGARSAVPTESSSNFTIIDDHAPPPYLARPSMKVCSITPASRRGTPKRRPNSSANPASLHAKSIVKPIS